MSSAQTTRLVYLVWTYKSWGGAQIYFLSIIRNAPAGWKFRVVLPSGVGQDLLNFFEAHGVEFEFLKDSFELVEAGSIAARLRRQWKRVRVEIEVLIGPVRRSPKDAIFHVEAGPWQSWAFLYVLASLRRTFVTLHNALPTPSSRFRRELWAFRLKSLLRLRNFTIFGANQNALDSLVPFVGAAAPEKLILTRATFDRADVEAAAAIDFDRTALRSKHGVPSDGLLFLTVGQFIDRKGRWVLLEAAKEVVAADPRAVFVWVGPQPLTEDERARIEGFALGEKFRYILSSDLGGERSAVLNFFRTADVFVLPSLWEGLPISILEAMALGVPVVSTSINAIPEAVIDGETGRLVPPGDAGSLAKILLEMAASNAERERLARNAKGFVYERFDEREAAGAVFDSYSDRSPT